MLSDKRDRRGKCDKRRSELKPAEKGLGACAWLLVLAALLTFTAICACPGCDAPASGLRWAPNEQQKEAAKASEQLAQVAAMNGLPPGSTAAQELARGAYVGAAYTGNPSNPVDITPLVPPGVRDAWKVKDEQLDAMKTKTKLTNDTSRIVTTKLAEIMQAVGQKGTTSVKALAARLQALADFQGMAAEANASISVPADPDISKAESDAMASLQAQLDKITAVASAAAVQQPTLGDVSDQVQAQLVKASDKAQGWIGTVSDIASTWGAPIAGTGLLGGLGLWLRGRSTAKTATAQVANAQAVADSHASTTQQTAALLGQLLQNVVQPAPAPAAPPTAAGPGDPSAVSALPPVTIPAPEVAKTS